MRAAAYCKGATSRYGDGITIHGHFKIANTVALDDYYTRAEWEVALRAAKHKAMEGEWPIIRPGDFFRERES
jgi:hypothetical protein